MKKRILAVMVSGLVFGGVATAQAASTTVTGGTVNFVGQVVDAACSVSADTTQQTVQLSQVRTAKLTTSGAFADQKEPFNIVLEDCDTTVSQNAGVTFNGQSDSVINTALANTAGAGSAANVALQLFGPDGQALNLGDASSTITLINGTNTIPLSVDYVATGTATPGSVAATATFNVNYS